MDFHSSISFFASDVFSICLYDPGKSSLEFRGSWYVKVSLRNKTRG